jgi:hypothetical protein
MKNFVTTYVETPEQRKQRLDQARLAYRKQIDDWARSVEDAADAHDPGYEFDESLDEGTRKGFDRDVLACHIAAELMRLAKPAQIKRAHAAVRAKRKAVR